MPDALDAAQLLDVQVQPLAGPLLLVAYHDRLGLKVLQASQTHPSQP
jgi:hypothetical protein